MVERKNPQCEFWPFNMCLSMEVQPHLTCVFLQPAFAGQRAPVARNNWYYAMLPSWNQILHKLYDITIYIWTGFHRLYSYWKSKWSTLFIDRYIPSQTNSSHDYFMFPAAKKDNVDKKKGRDISRLLKLSIMLHFVCHFTESDCRINPDSVFFHCYYPMGPFQCNAHTATLSARLIATRSTSHHQRSCPQQLLVYPQVRDQTRFVGRFLQEFSTILGI